MVLMNFAGSACSRTNVDPKSVPEPAHVGPSASDTGTQTAVFAGGCFWCVEGVFEHLDGVNAVVSGYAGGSAGTAHYESVSSGSTDHAEVVQISYDPQRISYGKLLKVFFTVAHDPTQLDRQGPDTGRQYRSAIFFQSGDEKQAAQTYIRQLEEAKVFDQPIVTKLEPLGTFYPAEDYHQDFVQHNPNHPYVRMHALPKVKKVRQGFADQLRATTNE